MLPPPVDILSEGKKQTHAQACLGHSALWPVPVLSEPLLQAVWRSSDFPTCGLAGYSGFSNWGHSVCVTVDWVVLRSFYQHRCWRWKQRRRRLSTVSLLAGDVCLWFPTITLLPVSSAASPPSCPLVFPSLTVLSSVHRAPLAQAVHVARATELRCGSEQKAPLVPSSCSSQPCARGCA